MRTLKSANSAIAGFRSQHVTYHVTGARHVVHHTKSLPISNASDQPQTTGAAAAVRPDSGRSKDADDSLPVDSATPRSGDVRRRPLRIDLGLPHSSRTTAAGSGAADSRSSAADSVSVARRVRSGSLVRRAVAAAAGAAVVRETPSPTADYQSRLSSGDVVRRVVWSGDGSDDLSARRNQLPTDSWSGAPDDNDGDSRPARRSSPGRCRAPSGGDPSTRARPTVIQCQLTWTQQRQPTTSTRPSTTTKATGALCSRIRILCFFSYFKKRDFFRFLNDIPEVMFSVQNEITTLMSDLNNGRMHNLAISSERVNNRGN